MHLLIYLPLLVPLVAFVSSHPQGEGNVHMHDGRSHPPMPTAVHEQVFVKRQNSSDATMLPPKPKLLANATQADIDAARALVKSTLAQTKVRNEARLGKPLRNIYSLTPGTVKRDAPSENTTVPELLPITQDMAAAAALVAEADAYDKLAAQYRVGNFTQNSPKASQSASSWWLGNIQHMGSWPWGGNSDFVVFRDVTAYGAVGDGVTDDTAAIMKAISDGNRCGPGCYGSSTTNAIIYFPYGKSGTYLVSSTIETYFGTQLIGDLGDPPIIKASASFTGLGVISTDKYVGGTGSDGLANEYFVNTANFYRQIRNLAIDITEAPNGIVGLHYQVAQATSLQNIKITASTASGTTQQGIFAENGSGGFMEDVTIEGGQIGIYCGNQQFTSHRITINNAFIAVQVIWDWGWTWKETRISNCDYGFALLNGNASARETGSILITDTSFVNTVIAVFTTPILQGTATGTTSITLDNVAYANVAYVIVDTNLNAILEDPPTDITWSLGNTFTDPANRAGSLINTANLPRDPLLVDTTKSVGGTSVAPYFTRAKPQYPEYDGRSFVHMKSSCQGDGATDDTACFQATLNGNVGSPIYIDAGSYILRDTITIPSGSIIIGEAWSQLVAYGPNFQDPKNPRALVAVGNPGDQGTVEIQDLIFTSKGPTPGLIAVQWNIRAAGNGQAGMWDCHVRLGGATGTELTSSNCPPNTGAPDSSSCQAGSMMMHITNAASAYLENVWLWVSDHDLDDPDWNSDNNKMIMNSVYVARGILVESTTPTFMYGTAAEHATFYQYTFYQAKNIVAGEIQTESPYYQPNPVVPAPFDADGVYNLYESDPPYADCTPSAAGCDSSWAVRFVQSQNITIYGAGLYSWFKDFDETCVDSLTCQVALVNFVDNYGSISMFNLVTIGTIFMAVSDGVPVYALENLEMQYHPWWSQISIFEPLADPSGGGGGNAGNGGGSGNGVSIDPKIWRSSSGTHGPTVSCSPPCTYVLPPITLPSPSTITFPASTTSLEVGCFITDIWTGLNDVVTSTTDYVSVTVTTVLTIPAMTVTLLPVSNVPIVSGISSTVIYPQVSLVPPPFVVTDDDASLMSAGYTCISSSSNTRSITPVPWPWMNFPVPDVTTTTPTTTTTPIAVITHTTGEPGPTCSGGCGQFCTSHCSWPCSAGCNTDGADCDGSSCTQGGDCAGPTCTAGGNCQGPLCKRGGDCTGPKCNHGGGCNGPLCDRGGSCWGLLCDHGGGCTGDFCNHGGGCGPFGCSAGGCTGPLCHTPGDDDDDDDKTDGDFVDSNDPNKVQPTSCATPSAYSSCQTFCIADGDSGCASSTTTCSNVIGCDTTGVTWASTVTPAPAFAMGNVDTWATGTDDLDADVAAATSIMSWLSAIGDYGSMTGTPTTTSAAPTGSLVPPSGLYIFLEEYSIESGDGQTTWHRNWEVFAVAGDPHVEPDVCDGDPLTEVTADSTGTNPGYPDVDLTFDSFWTQGSCKYTNQGSKAIGTMSCPGVNNIVCSNALDGPAVVCGDIDAVIEYPSILCTW